jgi:hypothetical protein
MPMVIDTGSSAAAALATATSATSTTTALCHKHRPSRSKNTRPPLPYSRAIVVDGLGDVKARRVTASARSTMRRYDRERNLALRADVLVLEA